MDKSTLSQYGWVTIVIIIIVILLGFATPFGNYISDNVIATLDSFSDTAGIGVVFGDGDFNGGTLGAVTNYTAEEIETNEHLYAIGYINPEDVVAVFNEDYTKVDIYKNSENSDGAIAWFYDEETDTFINSPMTEHAETLQIANINEGISSIGIAAFYNCNQLRKVSFPSTLAVIFPIGFQGCSNLTHVDIPSQPNSDDLSYLGVNAFADCVSLESVTLGNGLYCICDGLFQNCVSLKEVMCSPETALTFDVNGQGGENNTPPAFSGTNNVVIYGYGKNTDTGYGRYSITPCQWADSSEYKEFNVTYSDIYEKPQLTLEYIASTKQLQVEAVLNSLESRAITPIAEAYSLNYTSAFHLAILFDSGESENNALAIVNQGENYSRSYINENCIDILSDGNTNIKSIDDWFYVNIGIYEKDAITYMETDSWNTTVFAQDYADEIRLDIDNLVTDYGISYYSAVLIWIDKGVTYKEFTLAQQSESEIESYVNNYYSDLFRSESGDNSIDTADKYFKHILGATAHDVAYYIENDVWPK